MKVGARLFTCSSSRDISSCAAFAGVEHSSSAGFALEPCAAICSSVVGALTAGSRPVGCGLPLGISASYRTARAAAASPLASSPNPPGRTLSATVPSAGAAARSVIAASTSIDSIAGEPSPVGAALPVAIAPACVSTEGSSASAPPLRAISTTDTGGGSDI